MTEQEIANGYFWGKVYYALFELAIAVPLIIVCAIGVYVAFRKGWLK